MCAMYSEIIGSRSTLDPKSAAVGQEKTIDSAEQTPKWCGARVPEAQTHKMSQSKRNARGCLLNHIVYLPWTKSSKSWTPAANMRKTRN
mmetsp:Transcript_32615/g.68028  ORF Transcript_32615/g.68028 Transcript_32615/m.68028 type:complete len:89 (+) Transcript_32615:95-361(+)